MPDLDQTVLEWLKKQGYPLELRVGRAFRASGWDVHHARWYTDLESNKPREIDLYARLEEGESNPYKSATIALAIECKSSEKPWVVFTAADPVPVDRFIGSMVADGASSDALLVTDVQKIARPHLLNPAVQVGHGIVKALGENRSGDPTTPYAALRGVVGAAAALGREQEEVADMIGDGVAMATLTLPLVVFDGVLYQYALDADKQELLTRLDWTTANISRSDMASTVNVHIVTADYLDRWVASITPSAQRWCREMVPHSPSAYKLTLKRAERARRHEN